MRAESRTTQKDIARMLNISQATVARVVNNSSSVKEDTRKKVMELIEKFQYKRNKIASNLVKQSSKKIRISVIMPSNPKYFWSSMQAGIESGLNEIVDYGVFYEVHNVETYEIDKLEKQLEKVKRENIDYLVIFPLTNSKIVKILYEIYDMGTKVIFINDLIKDFPYLYYVGPDNMVGGRLAGELTGKFLKSRGCVIVVASGEFSSEIQERIYGFNEVIKTDFSDIKVNYFLYDASKENSYDITMDILKKYQEIDGIYSADGFIENVGKALYDAKRKGIVFIGHEYNSPALKVLMQENYITAAINQDSFKEGYYCIKILSSFLFEGKPIDSRSFYMGFRVVMKYNIDERVMLF